MEVNLEIQPIGFARIHVLSIFPAGRTPESFACLFANISGVPRDDTQRNGNEVVTGLTLREWVDRVHSEGGLCIGAHVNNKNGVRLAFRQAARDVLKLFQEDTSIEAEREVDIPDVLKNYLFDSGIDAIEVHKSDDVQHYRWVSEANGQTRSIATLLTFNAHTCEAFDRKERVTHVKMTSLDFDGLRGALRFPDTRIRFPHNLPTAPNPRLLGISIKGSNESFFEDVTLALAENLNCIIGVRGSGKSTIIEALRYVFGYNRSLNDLGKQMAEGIREMQNANLTGTMVRVAYRTRTGEDRILQATFDDKADYATKVFAINGDQLEIVDVEECGEFPLRLFGWSELETLGRVPTKQRDLLDRLIPDLAPATRRRDAIRQRLQVNRGNVAQCLAELRAAFEHNGSEITRFREFTNDFNTLNTEEVQVLFAALDLAKAKRRLLWQVDENVAEQMRRVHEIATISLRTSIDELLTQGNDELREWWHGSELQSLGLVAAETDASGLARQLSERLTAFGSTLAVRLGALDREVEKVEQDLQRKFDQEGNDSMQRIADLRQNAEQRLATVRESRRKYLAGWNTLEELLEERDAICEELVSVQNEIAGIRAKHNSAVEKTLNRFLPAWMKVSIDFRAGQDKTQYANALKTVVPGRANNVNTARIRQALEQHYDPVSCARMALRSEFGGLIGRTTSLGDKDVSIGQEEVDSWSSKISPYDRHDGADVQILAEDGERLGALLDLQETPWDDFATILLDGGPVNEKSPGQRASAMLPLIALAEEAPLVIDQPEDNLDKRLIGTVLMQVLAELKEKRQITVCTHDPNILVGGDAEQVIVLKAVSSTRGVVESHGSIDNPHIVETVIDLLEGGAEAFETRRRRYHL